MKPIETLYNGVKYRSRTEARWAVFFDAYGIDFTYEPEGYDLDGVWYLVDFWVPEWKSYVEIKNSDEPTALELEKARRLSDKSGKKVVIINGTPEEHECFLFEHGEHIYEKNGEVDACRLSPCRRCERMTVSVEMMGYGKGVFMGFRELGATSCKRYDCGDRMPCQNDRFKQAVNASRNERFGVHE